MGMFERRKSLLIQIITYSFVGATESRIWTIADLSIGPLGTNLRDHFVYAPSQWEMMLHCNVISNWLGPYTKLSLKPWEKFKSKHKYFLMRKCLWKSCLLKVQHFVQTSHMMWRDSPLSWPFEGGIHCSQVDSPHKEPLIQSFDSFFAASLNKLLNKQLICQLFEILWRSCEVTVKKKNRKNENENVVCKMSTVLFSLQHIAVKSHEHRPHSRQVYVPDLTVL